MERQLETDENRARREDRDDGAAAAVLAGIPAGAEGADEGCGDVRSGMHSLGRGEGARLLPGVLQAAEGSSLS